jgi:MarR family transcriptional regulator, transcriptional regulator for hemolysin
VQPTGPPVGLQLARAARLVARAFDHALSQEGGSTPVWLVLLNLKIRPRANQRELAEAVGIREATLTHHLNTMEKDGLLTRRRDQDNRRVHLVELTSAGEAAFQRLRATAAEFDQRLCRGISAVELSSLQRLLDRLSANVGTAEQESAPWAGLIEHQDQEDDGS